MTTVTMQVTPDMARQYLQRMKVQRDLRRNKVERIKRDVRRRGWKVMPHGIVFDREGYLIDGQHRLTYIIESGQTVLMRVTFNADPSLVYSIDDNQSAKTLRDALKMAGASAGYVSDLTAMTRMLWRALYGGANRQGVSVFLQAEIPSNDEGVELFNKHADDLLAAAQACHRLKNIVPLRSIVGYYAFLAMRVDRQMVLDFVDRLATGTNLKTGDPALLLRETYIANNLKRIKTSEIDQGIMTVTALNAILDGRKLKNWRGVEFGKGNIPETDWSSARVVFLS
jgi:hypothetical protein